MTFKFKRGLFQDLGGGRKRHRPWASPSSVNTLQRGAAPASSQVEQESEPALTSQQPFPWEKPVRPP